MLRRMTAYVNANMPTWVDNDPRSYRSSVLGAWFRATQGLRGQMAAKWRHRGVREGRRTSESTIRDVGCLSDVATRSQSSAVSPMSASRLRRITS
jgi:hypothetical protein